MAIDFNGTTSKLDRAVATLGVTTQLTVCVQVFADGLGETNAGRILVLDELGNSLSFLHYSVANTLHVLALFSGGQGNFTFPVSDSAWHSVGLSYDASLATNIPVAYVDFAPVTVTTVTAPLGTLTASNTGYCVGNRSSQDRTWDGMLGGIQVANVIWTPAEMKQACRRPGSVRRGLKLFLRMLNKNDIADLSGNGFNGTGTALTDRAGGPSSAPLYTDDQFTLMGDVVNQRLLYMGVG